MRSEILMDLTLDFEKPVLELENQIKELKALSNRPGIDISQELKTLQKKVDSLIDEIYTNLSPWEKVQLARHPSRPHTVDFIEHMIKDFHEIHGDRKFADDMAMITGFGYLDEHKVAIIGIEKGEKTNDRIKRNFGMPRPEGYRKALRVMKLASQFSIPIVTFVDTPGAFPGIGAEERGQSQAIAENLVEMFELEVPTISVVIGEGGSGGALGIAITDRTLMMEHSIYSVISPESCASILWSDPKMAETAANSLKLGAQQALELGVIDKIIDEPAGGAHRNKKKGIENVKKALSEELRKLKSINSKKIKKDRFEKYRQIGNKTLVENKSKTT